MNILDQILRPVQAAPDHLSERLLLALLVAFIAGQLNAWFYRHTHRGVSYSRTFTQALVLIAVSSALSMSLVAAHPMTAVGLLGGMAIIRFRTVVRDPRDTT